MDFDDCDHDEIIDGVCQECFEQVSFFFQNDYNESTKKKPVRRSMKNVTNSYIAEVINIMRGKIDADIMSRVLVSLEDNTVQIRNFETAKRVVFAYIYSEMYTRDLPPEKLFYTTPDRLIAIMGLSKKDATKSLSLINSSKINGPSFVMIHPYLYLIEFRRENPDSIISDLIDDDLVEKIKTSINFEIHFVSRENPVKSAISYMSLLSKKILNLEREGEKPIQDMYDFYGLDISQVKDTLPVIKRFFEKDFVK